MTKKIASYRSHLEGKERSKNTIRAYISDIITYYKDKEDYFNIEKYSVATLERRKYSLNNFFDFLGEKELKSNKKFKKSYVFQKDYIKSRDVKKMLKFLDEQFANEKSFKAKRRTLLKMIFISLGINEGLRVCEYHNLEFNKDEIEIKDSKGGNFRVIPLTKDTLEKIDRLYNFLKNPAGKVFQKENEKYITIRTFQSWMASIAKTIGIPKSLSHTHSLRHRFARNFLKANPSRLEQLSTIMGHRSIQTTLIYAKPSKKDIALGMNRACLSNQ